MIAVVAPLIREEAFQEEEASYQVQSNYSHPSTIFYFYDVLYF